MILIFSTNKLTYQHRSEADVPYIIPIVLSFLGTSEKRVLQQIRTAVDDELGRCGRKPS